MVLTDYLIIHYKSFEYYRDVRLFVVFLQAKTPKIKKNFNISKYLYCSFHFQDFVILGITFKARTKLYNKLPSSQRKEAR